MIDFGNIQLGSYKMEYLTLQNPFNETLHLSLFVGRNTDLVKDDFERIESPGHDHRSFMIQKTKGTKFEKLLLEDIAYKMTDPSQKDKFQDKIHRLPDMQKFCKNVRAQIAEQRAAELRNSRDEPFDSQKTAEKVIVEM